ncbi:hypothetical protein GTO87_05125 [Ligilactobacillus saerimneri]|uniref:LSM domain protein n=1 Tax=Ligilactobacillus saerimneri TaxID=228229 RepID=A0A7H9EL96_9LACO|nr:hypothetical protein [Ligilactobacillus saerimneri]QLL78042.1 hypothetical protein GTO87_05125 [Ligilactobacillus saerimneri]
MKLEKYLGEQVRLIDNDGKVWEGKVVSLDLAINYDDIEYDELDLEVEGYTDTILYAFPENEIKSIEIIK